MTDAFFFAKIGCRRRTTNAPAAGRFGAIATDGNTLTRVDSFFFERHGFGVGS
jgi:hypothetical protein